MTSIRVPPSASEKLASVNARKSAWPLMSSTVRSSTSRSNFVTSTNLPRAQCSTPSGARMSTSNGPPTRISTFASGTVNPAGANQCFTWSAELQALNTSSRGACSVREIRTGGGSSGRLLSTVLAINVSFRFQGCEIIPQPVEAALPFAPPRADPLFRQAQRLRIDAASPHAAGLRRAYEARRFQHGEVLHHRRKRHLERPRQFADRNRLLRQALDDLSPRRIGEGLKGSVQRLRLVKHKL